MVWEEGSREASPYPDYPSEEVNSMKSLKIALWIAAIGCLIAVPFIMAPWSVIEKLIQWYGIEPLPGSPVVIYLFRTACGLFGLIGIYYLMLARNPLGYGRMLDLGVYGLVIMGLLALISGLIMELSPKIYIGDALFGLILGIISSVLSVRTKKALST